MKCRGRFWRISIASGNIESLCQLYENVILSTYTQIDFFYTIRYIHKYTDLYTLEYIHKTYHNWCKLSIKFHFSYLIARVNLVNFHLQIRPIQ